MTLEEAAGVVAELAARGYNADREAVTLLANAPDTAAAVDRAVEHAPDDAAKLPTELVRSLVGATPSGGSDREESAADPPATTAPNPSVSTGTNLPESNDDDPKTPVETKGSAGRRRSPTPPETSGDVTSTGTGEYRDFVSVFRDRYERLAGTLRGRVNHRPADTIADMTGGSDAAMIGLVSDVRSTAGGHWLVELEDTTGTFPCLVMEDREFAPDVRRLLHDEALAVEGTLADDGGVLFVDAMYFPDVPRTHTPSTADRQVRAALVSDVHVGSQEFRADAWQRFADWLHTEEAADVEYLLVGGDMVEGVGVYPDQDEELDIVDIYDQYEAFSEHLKDVPGDMEVVMIPGNHDAVRLAEPQPAFDEELRSIMTAHDAEVAANPATVTVEGVTVLMYHGVSLDELIAELPDDAASYDRPHEAMYQLLKKRHLAPQYGGRTRIAPEAEDTMVIDEVPDIFHAGHVHKLGYGKYNGVLTVNSACWQAQTAFQESVNLEPDVGYAPIVDLQTLDLTVRKFV